MGLQTVGQLWQYYAGRFQIPRRWFIGLPGKLGYTPHHNTIVLSLRLVVKLSQNMCKNEWASRLKITQPKAGKSVTRWRPAAR